MNTKLLKKLRKKAREKFTVLQENEKSYWIAANGSILQSFQSKEKAIYLVDKLRKDEIEFHFKLIKYKKNFFEKIY